MYTHTQVNYNTQCDNTLLGSHRLSNKSSNARHEKPPFKFWSWESKTP